MPTGFNVPFEPYDRTWEIKKICVFIGLEIGIVLIAFIYKHFVVNKSVLGPTDDELRRRDQVARPDIWHEYERQFRQRNQILNRPFVPFFPVCKASSSVSPPDASINGANLNEESPHQSQGSGVAKEVLGTVEEAVEEASPPKKPSTNSDVNSRLAETNKDDVNPKLVRIKPVLAIDTQPEPAKTSQNVGSTKPEETSSSRLGPEMAEVCPPLLKLEPDAASSAYDSPRTRSPASIIRMYTEDEATYFTRPSTSSPVAQPSSSSPTRSIVVEPIKTSSADERMGRSRYQQRPSPIDKNGRKGRESVSPKELKRQGVLRKVRKNVRKSSADQDE